MSGELVLRSYDGYIIEQRRQDRYMNATAMCRANGKLWGNYWKSPDTQEFIAELAATIPSGIDELVQSRPGNPEHGGGTWVHPRVSIHLAHWLSARFAVQVSGWIEELLTTGTVSLAGLSSFEIMRRSIDALEQAEREIRLAQLTATRAETTATEAKGEAYQAKRLASAAVDIHTSNYGHYTVLGYCSVHGLPCDIRTAAKHGAALTRLCKAKGVTVSKVKDPRFGEVNQYPENVLDDYFGTTEGGAA